MPQFYMLDDQGQPVPVKDARVWGRWFETADRTVVSTNLGELGRVSTVFLGMDHAYGLGPNPVLWEMLVFDGPLAGEMLRFTSCESARAGHHAMVRRLRELAARAKRQLAAKEQTLEQVRLAQQPKMRRFVDWS